MDERAVAWREGVERCCTCSLHHVCTSAPREQEEARRAQEFRASEATVLRLPPFVPRLEERWAVGFLLKSRLDLFLSLFLFVLS